MTPKTQEPARALERQEMVDSQIKSRGVVDPRVLEALLKVPRHEFVPEDMQDDAYEDSPLPIGYNQTISQPYIVGFMTQEAHLNADDRVLEIGTGCGYQTAVLAQLVREVYTIEIVEPLAQEAWARFKN